MDSSEFTLWGLFFSSLLSSTLLPGGSEAVLAWLAADDVHDPVVLLLVATLGNTLGGMSSWGLGRFLVWRFPARALQRPQQQRALARIERWGSPVLLFSWLPIVGDPLCLVAGWLRIRWWLALVFIALGKMARYAVVLYLVPGP